MQVNGLYIKNGRLVRRKGDKEDVELPCEASTREGLQHFWRWLEEVVRWGCATNLTSPSIALLPSPNITSVMTKYNYTTMAKYKILP